MGTPRAMMLLAGRNSGHSASLWFLIPILIAMAFIFAVSIFRMRRGGPGPGVRYVPRRWRAAVNRRYQRKGWQLPYDSSGNRNPDRTQL